MHLSPSSKYENYPSRVGNGRKETNRTDSDHAYVKRRAMPKETEDRARKVRRRGFTSKLPGGYRPGETDVICAKGKQAFNHVGNIRFRSTIASFQEAYSIAATKVEKTAIVTRIIDSVKCCDPPGRFVREDQNGGWSQLGDAAAREKVGAGFRDLLHTSYKSSGRSKRIRRRIQKRDSMSSAAAEENTLQRTSSQASGLDSMSSSSSLPGSFQAESSKQQNEEFAWTTTTSQVGAMPIQFEDAYSGRIQPPALFENQWAFEDGRITKESTKQGTASDFQKQALPSDPLSSEPTLLASMFPESSSAALPSAQSLVQSVFEGTSGEGESSEEDKKPSAL